MVTVSIITVNTDCIIKLFQGLVNFAFVLCVIIIIIIIIQRV